MMRLVACYTLAWQDNSQAPAPPGAVRKWHWGFDGSRGNWAILLGCGRRLRELDRDRLAAEIIAGIRRYACGSLEDFTDGVQAIRTHEQFEILQPPAQGCGASPLRLS